MRDSVLQCVAVCCSVITIVTTEGVLLLVEKCKLCMRQGKFKMEDNYSDSSRTWSLQSKYEMHCVAVCRSVLQFIAVCCSVLQCSHYSRYKVCCSVLQCVAMSSL